MATIKKLYQEGKYREVIAAVEGNKNPGDERLLQAAWAHHQLGEYTLSIPIMEDIVERHSSRSEVGRSARRGLAHGLIQWNGDLKTADAIMQQISPGLDRDNVRVNIFLVAARKKVEIPASEVIAIITNAINTVPYATVNGHVVSNGALALHEARGQEMVKPYLPILSGLMSAAISIYEVTGTAKNHIAGAEFRDAQICRANGLLEPARFSAEESVNSWRELVNSQDGARYKQNLEGAEKLLREIMQEIAIFIPRGQ
jgi:hypothetical protein